MAYEIKYSTTPVDNTIKKGNLALAINDVDYGPTSTTGFYAGLEPPSGGYVIYNTSGSNIYSYVASNDSELIGFTKNVSGTTFATAQECLEWFSTQDGAIVIASSDNMPNMVTDGLVLNLNAGNVLSYPTTSSTWYDISPSGSNSGSLTNGPTFDSNGAIVFDGVDDYVDGIQETTFPIGSQDQTIETVAYLNSKSAHGIFSYGKNATGKRVELGCRDTWIVVALGGGAYGVNDSNNFGKWVHITAVPGATTADLTLYINGESKSVSLQGGASYTKNITSTGRYFVGTVADNNGGPFSQYTLDGSVAYVRLYNKVLSAQEIKQNYYQAPIVTDGLVFALDAGNLVSYESGSTTTYSLTGSLSGSLVNGTGFDRSNGGSWEFDGTDDYVNLGNNFSFNSSFSLEVWIKNTNQSVDGLITKDDVSSNREWNFHITSVSSNPYSLRFRINGVDTVDGTTVIGNDNTWHQCVAIYNGSQMLIYLDTVLDNSKNVSGTPTINTSAECQIGNFDGNVYPYDGNIAITRIYNRALSQTEITQNFNAQRKRFGI